MDRMVLGTGLMTGYGTVPGRLWVTLPTVLISHPAMSMSCSYLAFTTVFSIFKIL
jgi:hypothetical protein